MDLHLPVFYPADVQEALDLGRHAIAMSRLTGLWTSMKLVAAVAARKETQSKLAESNKLRAELEAQLFEAGRGQRVDAGAGGGSARERNHRNVGVRDQGFADAGTGSVHNIQHTRRKPYFMQNFTQQVGRVGRHLRRLGHDRVAGTSENKTVWSQRQQRCW